VVASGAKPLTYRDRDSSGTQLDVLCGDIVIANIYKATFSSMAGGDAYWNWTFYFTARPPEFELHGTAASRDIACLAVERNWEVWLDAAGLQEQVKP
jgi:hypothetical protein